MDSNDGHCDFTFLRTNIEIEVSKSPDLFLWLEFLLDNQGSCFLAVIM